MFPSGSKLADLTKTILIASCFLFWSGIHKGYADAGSPVPMVEPASLVKVMTVSSSTANVRRTFFGQIASKQTVDLGFQVAGRILMLPVSEGQVLPKGTVIAQLDRVPFEIEAERARLALEQAERTLARYKKLSGTTISEAQILDVETQVKLASVELKNAEYALEQTTLTAPFDAVVAGRAIANFSTVAAGTQVVRLHDMSETRVNIDVPEILMQAIGENPDVTLTAMFPQVDRIHFLEFREVRAEASQLGQTFKVSLGMETPDDLLLLPGASVTVEAVFHSRPRGFQIPSSAIAIDAQGNTSVLKVMETNGVLQIARTGVTLEVSAQGDIDVVDGVSAGDEIVAGGVHALTDGQSVRRFTSDFE